MRQRLRGGAREIKRALTTHRPPARPDRPWSVSASKGLQERRTATDQRQPGRASVDKPRRERIDSGGGKTDQFARDSVASAACSNSRGASDPKSAGRRRCAQATIACGSLRELVGRGRATGRSRRCGHRAPIARGAALRSRARRRCLRRKSAYPSRRRDRICPLSIAQPTVPVPATMTPPSRSPCAPRQAACASVVTTLCGTGADAPWRRPDGSARWRRPRPGRRQLVPRRERGKPAWPRHGRGRSEHRRKAFARGRGAGLPARSALRREGWPEKAHRRARQLVPPPSMPSNNTFLFTVIAAILSRDLCSRDLSVSVNNKNQLRSKWFAVRDA